MQRLRALAALLAIAALAGSAVVVWREVLARDRGGLLTVAFLDVGQGDAIYIESPSGTQVVVDGGPDASVVSQLSSVMDPLDRTLDAIIVTNPDQDHFAGFIPLTLRYEVAYEFEPGTKKNTVTYRALESALADSEVKRLLAKRGMVLDLGGGAALSILYPDRDVSNTKPNDGSIVMRLTYASTSVMLMGDATALVEERVMSLGTTTLRSDILKLGHHGSKTSSSAAWLLAVAPKEAVVSAGCNNSYGHPSKEIVDRLASRAIPLLSTCKEGNIEFVSDGVGWVRQ